MHAQYQRLMRLYALLNELTAPATVYDPYRPLIERVAKRYDIKLRQLFYQLLDVVTRLQLRRTGANSTTVQVTREDIYIVLSLMKGLLAPPRKDIHISEGALRTYCFLLDHGQGLSMRELAIRQRLSLSVLKHHTLALHRQGYITREWRQGRRQRYYVYKAVLMA